MSLIRRLFDRLITSLDVDIETEAAWDARADQREEEIETGTVETVPLDESTTITIGLQALHDAALAALEHA